MKTKLSHLLLATALTGAASAVPNANPDGLTIGPAINNSGIFPNGDDLDFWVNGSLLLYSGLSSSNPAAYTIGGVTTYGNPVNIVLASDDLGSNSNQGVFAVWGQDNFNSSPAGDPLFRIDSPTNIATFEDVDVVIKDGTLTVGTSPVLTEASSPTFLGGLTPPTTTSWTNTYLARGNVSNGAAFAIGTTYTSANGASAVAIGHGSTATGEASFAIGNGAVAGYSYSYASGVGSEAGNLYARATGNFAAASSTHSFANGEHATANGRYSFSHGNYTSSKSSDEVSFGRYNIESTPTGPITLSGLDGLFRLGNGTSTTRSDAMTVLKSGQTSLTNKEWKAAYTATPTTATALANPASTTDSDGNALVVDGHTILNGKVVISVPQGDISMGDYE